MCFKIGQKSNGNNLCSKCFSKIAGRMLISFIPNTYFEKTIQNTTLHIWGCHKRWGEARGEQEVG